MKGENMKVIKRDGRAVEYDREKIQTAIEKANQEVNSVINFQKDLFKYANKKNKED